MRIWALSILTIVSFSLFAFEDFDREQIEDRISPVGHVHVEAAASPNGGSQNPIAVKPAAAKLAPGQAIYEQYCIVCHRDGVAGAPKFREEADWGPRQTKQSIDSLTQSALKGLNAMPAKGTCQECSESDLKAAIQYMVPQ